MVLIILIAEQQYGLDVVSTDQERLISGYRGGNTTESRICDKNNGQSEGAIKVRLRIAIGTGRMHAAGGLDQRKVNVRPCPSGQRLMYRCQEILISWNLRLLEMIYDPRHRTYSFRFRREMRADRFIELI